MNVRYYKTSWKYWSFGVEVSDPRSLYLSQWEVYVKLGPIGELAFWSPIDKD